MLITALFVSIVAGLGVGLLSCSFFLYRWLVGVPPALLLWIGILTYAGAAAAVFSKWIKPHRMADTRKYRLPATLFAVACASFGAFVLIHSIDSHGDWDAWAIWNLHARFLFRGGAAAWRAMFSRDLYWTHADYPLLLPSLVASGWQLLHSETTAIPAFVATMFTFGIIALVASAVSFLANDARGLAAGLVLLGTSDFVIRGSYQMADVPLGFFILLTVVLLYLSDKFEGNAALTVMAGMSAGFAAWTKNEGLLFLVCIVAARVLVGGTYKPWSVVFRELRMFFYGAAPILGLVLAFKFLLSPPNDLFLEPDLFVGRLKSSARYMQIGAYFARGIANFGEARISPLFAIAAYFVYVWRRSNKMSTAQLSGLALLVLMLSGYFLIYVISPHDLQWHLDSSFNRLLLHLWPTFVFCIGCVGLTVGEAVTEKPPRLTVPALGFAAVVAVSLLIARSPGHSLLPTPPDLSTVNENGIHVKSAALPVRIDAAPLSLVSDQQQPEASGHASLETENGADRVSGVTLLRYRPDPLRYSEAMIPAVSPVRSGVIWFRSGVGYRTTVSMANASGTAANITFSIEPAHEETFTLHAHQQLSVFVDETPFNARNRVGTVVFKSSAPVSVGSLLTFQVMDTPFLMAKMPIANPDSTARGTTHIPYIRQGGGWSTELVLINPTGEKLSGHHRWYLESGKSGENVPYSIPPRSSIAYRNAAVPAGVQIGRIEIEPEESQSVPSAVAVLFAQKKNESSLVTVEASAAAPEHATYIEVSDFAGTELAIANASQTPTTATVRIGASVRDVNIASGSVVIVPSETPTRTIARISARSPIAVAALRNIASPSGRRLITAYRTNFEPGVFFPDFAVGNTFSTEFVLFSSSSNPVSGFLKFFGRTGAPLELSLIRK